MAIFNEILSGRYNRALQKLFAIKGSPPVRQLGGEVMPIVQIFYGAENRYLETWDRFSVGISQPGVAAVLSTIKIRNPVGSNVMAVFEKITGSQNAVDFNFTLQAGTDQTDGATAVPMVSAQNLDSRSGRVSSLIFSRSGAAAPPSQVAWANISLLANTPYEFIGTDIQELTLNPGRSLQLVSTNVNQILNGTFVWRERLLEESERSLNGC
jgi:hypothetical protein